MASTSRRLCPSANRLTGRAIFWVSVSILFIWTLCVRLPISTSSILVGLLFPYLNKKLGAYSFAPFAGVLLFVFAYAWALLPETAGTTPAELQAQLVEKNKNNTYHNMDIQQMSNAPPSHDEWMSALAAIESEGRT